MVLGREPRWTGSEDSALSYMAATRGRFLGRLAWLENLTAEKLGISKRGNSYVRKLLVNSAHYTIGKLNKTDTDLRRWGLAHAGTSKKQKKRAVVAVARKLAVVMAAILRSGNPYVPLRRELAEKIPA